MYAALDVFHTEPLSPDYPLLHLPNVICTPHLGSFSRYWRQEQGASVVADLQRWLEGKPLQGEVTRAMYERQTPK